MYSSRHFEGKLSLAYCRIDVQLAAKMEKGKFGKHFVAFLLMKKKGGMDNCHEMENLGPNVICTFAGFCNMSF